MDVKEAIEAITFLEAKNKFKLKSTERYVLLCLLAYIDEDLKIALSTAAISTVTALNKKTVTNALQKMRDLSVIDYGLEFDEKQKYCNVFKLSDDLFLL